MSKPLPVSVIIPTYNRGPLVGRAVASVLATTTPDDEVIVVDDGSTDRTEEALAPYLPRILYIRTPNAGAGAARNRGIGAASRPLVAFLDSDDEWMPDKLRLQRPFMQARPDVLFCFSDFGVRKTNGSAYRRYLSRWHGDPRSWNEILGPGVAFSSLVDLPPGRQDFLVHVGSLYADLACANYVSTITLMVRREAAAEALRFAEDLPTYEDWECFARLARAGPAAYLDCETAWQWGHEGPRLTDTDDYRSASARMTLLERVWGRDEAYLAAHGERFRRRLAELHRVRANWLLRQGRCREARGELRLAGGDASKLRLLALLPGPLVRWVGRAMDGRDS
jgi:glycosyltransferase involved in cell wall biosynthesis